jgi:hypothetical protein
MKYLIADLDSFTFCFVEKKKTSITAVRSQFFKTTLTCLLILRDSLFTMGSSASAMHPDVFPHTKKLCKENKGKLKPETIKFINQEIEKRRENHLESLKSMATFLKTLDTSTLLARYAELKSKLNGGLNREAYMLSCQDIFRRADDNGNGIIEILK